MLTGQKPPGESWPANRPPEEEAREQRLRVGDREAGFEIRDDFEPFDQRNDMFCRVQWDQSVMSDAVADFYAQQKDPKPRKADGFLQRDFALRNASWVVARTYSERGQSEGKREGFQDPIDPYHPPAAEKLPVDDAAQITNEVKRVARFLGADLVGIAEYDERWVYSQKFSIIAKEARPNELPAGLKTVIVVGHAMDYGLINTFPSATGSAAVGKGYSAEAANLAMLAQYIRNLGYEAVANMNDTALAIPFAVKAGLGEYGRHQMVISKEFGPRVRFSKVFTDMPLTIDRPQPFGVSEFCGICDRCADACPPRALPFGPPSFEVANRSGLAGVKKWTSDAEKCFDYWTRIKTDCGICMRVCPYNKDFSRPAMRALRWLMGTRLRRLALWLDVKLGFGKRKLPADWWQEAGVTER